MSPNALFWLGIGPALAAIVSALVADAFGGRSGTTATLSAAVLLAAGGIVSLVGGWTPEPIVWREVFVVGAGRSPIAGVVLLLSALALMGSVSSSFGRSGRGAALVALAATGSALALLSQDLLMTLLCLETAAVGSYALVGMAANARAKEAAFKYFMQGAVASGLLTMGVVALASAMSGALGYADVLPLSNALGNPTPALAALVLICSVFAFKASAAPFHSWAPDAYETAPPEAAAVLAGPVKLGAVSVLAALFLAVVGPGETMFAKGSLSGGLALVLGALAVASVVAGSLLALGQTSLRRMLGYAGVAQAGYGLIAVAAFNPSAAIVHLTLYSIASVAVFMAAGAFEKALPRWDGTIGGLAGFGRSQPLLGTAVTVALASLAGLPPFGGFWGKFQALSAPLAAAVAVPTGDGRWAVAFFGAVAAVGVIGSVVSVAYYGAVVRTLFFSVRTDDGEVDAVPRSASSVAIGLAVGLIVLGVTPLFTGVWAVVSGFVLTR